MQRSSEGMKETAWLVRRGNKQSRGICFHPHICWKEVSKHLVFPVRETLFSNHIQKGKQAWWGVSSELPQCARRFASGWLPFVFKACAASCYAYDHQIMMTESNHKWKNKKIPCVMALPLWVIGVCKWGLLAIFPIHRQSLAFLVLASVAVKLKQEKNQLWEEVMKLTDNSSRYLDIYFLRSVLLAFKNEFQVFRMDSTVTLFV